MSTVTVTFAGGSDTFELKYQVKDLAEYEVGVANGSHDKIMSSSWQLIRGHIGEGYRYVSTAVDGVVQVG